MLEPSLSFDLFNCNDVTAGIAVTGTCGYLVTFPIISEDEVMLTLVEAPDKEE